MHERNQKLANNLNDVMDDTKRQVTFRGVKSVTKQDSLKITSHGELEHGKHAEFNQ